MNRNLCARPTRRRADGDQTELDTCVTGTRTIITQSTTGVRGGTRNRRARESLTRNFATTRGVPMRTWGMTTMPLRPPGRRVRPLIGTIGTTDTGMRRRLLWVRRLREPDTGVES